MWIRLSILANDFNFECLVIMKKNDTINNNLLTIYDCKLNLPYSTNFLFNCASFCGI